MKTEQQVRAEIYWQEREQNRVRNLIFKNDWSEGDIDELNIRLTSLSFAIEWCKWFLKEVN